MYGAVVQSCAKEGGGADVVSVDDDDDCWCDVSGNTSTPRDPCEAGGRGKGNEGAAFAGHSTRHGKSMPQSSSTHPFSIEGADSVCGEEKGRRKLDHDGGGGARKEQAFVNKGKEHDSPYAKRQRQG